MLTRRAALTALAGLTAVRGARAQPRPSDFPSRPITIVVPYPAGGPVEVTARLIAQAVGKGLGQPILVDNRGGGAGVVGSLTVAHAEPDGHTLILGTNQTHATNQSLLKNCPYDAVTDFAPVVGVAEIAHVLVVRHGLAAGDVGELVKLATASPGELNYASTGIGSASHLAAELFKTRAGVELQHIPFRGSAPMTTELLAGRVDLTFATLPSVVSYIDAGVLRALAVASPRRTPRLPDLPTLAEAGVPGVEADAWSALFAPAKTPPDVIERLYASVAAALKKESIQAALNKQGLPIALKTPAEMSAMLPAEVEKWAAVIRTAHVTVE
jgi:tripartite-type tricarboxylate transporter receptor subunit TctC